MKTTLCNSFRMPALSWCILLAGVPVFAQQTSSSPSGESPAAHFMDKVVFHAAFDGSVAADITPGNGKPQTSGPGPAFVPGMRGKAVQATAALVYSLGDTNTLGMRGAASFWLSSQSDDEKAVANPAYYFPLQLLGPDGKTLNIGRMGNPANGRKLYIHFQGNGSKPAIAIQGNTLTWQKNDWHLIVACWAPGWIEISIDGQEPEKTSLSGEITPAPFTRLVVAPFPQNEPFAMEDLILYDQPLSPDDISWLMKAR